jgi:hypothetical protein
MKKTFSWSGMFFVVLRKSMHTSIMNFRIYNVCKMTTAKSKQVKSKEKPILINRTNQIIPHKQPQEASGFW